MKYALTESCPEEPIAKVYTTLPTDCPPEDISETYPRSSSRRFILNGPPAWRVIAIPPDEVLEAVQEHSATWPLDLGWVEEVHA